MSKLAKKNPEYSLVVLADVRDSRELTDRSELQGGLVRLIGRLNEQMSGPRDIPFSISGGDEIQGLLQDPSAAVSIIDDMDHLATTFRFRIGVGWGRVATPRASRTWEMDGECFHLARAAIIRGKKEGRWVAVAGFPAAGDQILEGLYRGMQVIREGWTERQRLAVATRKTCSTQSETAEKLGLDDSTLSKMLKAASFKQLVEMETAATRLIRMLVHEEGGNSR
jgi:hypothetical protein